MYTYYSHYSTVQIYININILKVFTLKLRGIGVWRIKTALRTSVNKKITNIVKKKVKISWVDYLPFSFVANTPLKQVSERFFEYVIWKMYTNPIPAPLV